MKNELDVKLEVDRVKIKNAVRLQTPIEITSYTLPRNMEVYIRSVLAAFLEECHQEHLQEYLTFCLGELLTNAKKANTKRVYFKEKGFDINNPDDYEKGMENFKEETLTNIDHYLELQKKDGMYIKLDMQLRGDKIKIEIRNKAQLTVFEKKRIQHKIDTVQKYNSMEDVLANVIDQTEGAGLGIIIIILMLQKVGLAKENYQVESKGEETITRIILPCNEKIFAAEEMMNYEFVNLQNTIPVLKSHFDELLPLFESNILSREEILKNVREDPTLSILLLKEALKQDSNVVEIPKAMELLSDEDLRRIYSADNKEIYVVDDTAESTRLWNHAKNTAFFAYNLTKNMNNLEAQYSAEELYSAGLLNSLGLVLLESATEEQRNYMKEFTAQYEFADKLCDVFWGGNSHNYINLIYAKRLGFSDDFACKISYWNYWEMAPEKFLNAIYTVYISEMIQHYTERQIDYYQVDKRALDYFGIKNESQFCMLAKKMTKTLSV